MKVCVVRSLVSLALLTAFVPPAPGQIIVPKTVPVHQGQQFEIFPSDRAGMAGVSIALDDTLLDPFINPAKSARAPAGLIQISPFIHTVSLEGGGGRTVPLSAFLSSGRWSGVALFSLQQLDRPSLTFNEPLSARHSTNEYVAASLARRVGAGFVLGANAYWSDLGGVDGVEKLYSGSDRIGEDGGQLDLRLGLMKESVRGHVFELIVLNDRYHMTHDVHYQTVYQWDPCCGGSQPPRLTPEHSEHNTDRTNIWGIHTEFSQPVGSNGWRVGWLATVNRLTHPKIPNYQIMNVPRDPGHTNAFNGGIGIARSARGTTLGIDVILEPMWSHTWATAARDTMTAVDGIIHAGERTVDNHFRFANTLVRVGVAQDIPMNTDSSATVGLQAGLGLYAIKYRLRQSNYVSFVDRTQDENWMEWTPTLGVHFRGRDVQVSYDFSVTCGPNCGNTERHQFFLPPVAADPSGGVIAAPSGPLTFDGGSVTRHRLTFSFRMR